MKEKCVLWETWKLHRPPQGKEGLLLKDIRIFLLGEADPTWQMGWFGWGTPWKNPGEINLTGGLYMLCGLGICWDLPCHQPTSLLHHSPSLSLPADE